MKQLRDILGYSLGFVLFVGLIPTLMWLVSGRPAFWSEVATKDVVAWGLMLCGLLLSIWTIVYMKLRGKGNPMDAFNHEVAPRTSKLMVDGPYAICRNPMLLGVLIYCLGIVVLLWSVGSVIVFVVYMLIMSVQVFFEEKRLEKDFGEEYVRYKEKTKRLIPFVW